MTTESWGVALLVLTAVLVGAAIPALVQLRATLRAMERTLQSSGGRLDAALDATSTAAGKIEALVVRLEGGGKIEELLDGITALSRMVTQLRDTVRVASAVGAAVAPAVAAAVHAFREDRAEATPGPTPPAHHAAADSGANTPTERERQAVP